MTNSLLVFNTGSSSIKFALFAIDEERFNLKSVIRGQIESLGENPHFFIKDAANMTLHDELYSLVQKDLSLALTDAIKKVFGWLDQHLAHYKIQVVGHRVVHGGDLYKEPIQINKDIISQLEKFNPLAPLHQPFNLAAIKAVNKHYPGLCQVACFDTAFHQTQNPLTQAYALPHDGAT